MKPCLQQLYDEHQVIVNAIDAVKEAARLIGTNDAQYAETCKALLGFFRQYADRYHHYKEESILFPEMVKRNELLETGLIGEMLDEHSDFRALLQEIEDALLAHKYPEAAGKWEIYAHALLDHISVENEEVFPMSETLIPEPQLENIGFLFQDCDAGLGDQQKAEWERLVDEIRKRLLS